MFRFINGEFIKDLNHNYNLILNLGYCSDAITMYLYNIETGKRDFIFLAEILDEYYTDYVNLSRYSVLTYKVEISNMSSFYDKKEDAESVEMLLQPVLEEPTNTRNILKIFGIIEKYLKSSNKWKDIWNSSTPKGGYKEQPVIVINNYNSIICSYNSEGVPLSLCQICNFEDKNKIYISEYNCSDETMTVAVYSFNENQRCLCDMCEFKGRNILEEIYMLTKVSNSFKSRMSRLLKQERTTKEDWINVGKSKNECVINYLVEFVNSTNKNIDNLNLSKLIMEKDVIPTYTYYIKPDRYYGILKATIKIVVNEIKGSIKNLKRYPDWLNPIFTSEEDNEIQLLPDIFIGVRSILNYIFNFEVDLTKVSLDEVIIHHPAFYESYKSREKFADVYYEDSCKGRDKNTLLEKLNSQVEKVENLKTPSSQRLSEKEIEEFVNIAAEVFKKELVKALNEFTGQTVVSPDSNSSNNDKLIDWK